MAGSIYKPLPNDFGQLDNELKESFKNFSSSFGRSGRQKLLCSMRKTSALSRSGHQCSILLVGSSGVGKSSTANHLFNLCNGQNTEVAKTNAITSGTRQTKEYLIQADSAIYQVSNLTVGIIDTPGFQDTSGHVQDACNMHSIRKFFKTHPRLANSYPNLIFVCFSATDVRYSGENSNFIKSLKCLRKLRLIDDQNPNVIAIITKVCLLSPKHFRNLNGWVSTLDKMKKDIRDIIFSYLHVTCPVVVLENMYEDEDLERPAGPDGRPSDFTLLPNKEQQPLNLFYACRDILQNNRDTFAEICLNACFMSGNVNPPLDGFFVSPKNASTEILTSEEEEMKKFFEAAAVGDTVDPLAEKAREYFLNHSLDENDKEEIREIICKLRRISPFNDFKGTTINALNYHMKSDLSPRGIMFLRHLSVMRGEPFTPDYKFHCGYNIFIDKQMEHKIFNYSNIVNRFGLSIPENFIFLTINNETLFEDNFDDENAFIQHRLNQLKVDVVEQIDTERYSYHSRPGSLIRQNDIQKQSKLIEYRKFQLIFDFTACSKCDLTDEFKLAVHQLPEKYNLFDNDSCSRYEAFFDKWGHFFTTSMYGGGSVEKIEKLSSESADRDQRVDETTIRWQGGDTEYHREDTFDDFEQMVYWEGSLMRKPMILTSEMRLEPISTAVALCSKQKREQVHRALLVHLNFDMVLFRRCIEAEIYRQLLQKAGKRKESTSGTDVANTIVGLVRTGVSIARIFV